MDQAAPSLMQLRWKWHMFAVAALAFARVLAGLERAGARGVWAKAHVLEIISLAAYTDVCRAAETIQPGEPDADKALAHLNTIALALLAIALILQGMKARLAGQGIAASRRACEHRPAPVLGLCAITRQVPYRDSG